MSEQYKNCTISTIHIPASDIQHGITGYVYRVDHNISHNNIHAVKLAEAYRLAGLFDMENDVCNFVKQFNDKL